MRYEWSPNIAIYVRDLEEARLFYMETLGFKELSPTGDFLTLSSGPCTLFLTDKPGFTGAVHELFVDDVEIARNEMLKQGCEVLVWEGKGRDCYIKDPNGIIFNLWEK